MSYKKPFRNLGSDIVYLVLYTFFAVYIFYHPTVALFSDGFTLKAVMTVISNLLGVFAVVILISMISTCLYDLYLYTFKKDLNSGLDKVLFCIVGETGAGKDTVTELVCKALGWSHIPSYTTRGMRDYEKQGVQHTFISDEEFDRVEKEETIIAYTKTGEYRYCATVEQLGDSRIYIVNPCAIREAKQNPNLGLRLVTIYVTLPYEERRQRALDRSDFNTSFEDRVKAEQDDFYHFNRYQEYDYAIKNTDSEKTASVVLEIIKQESTQKVKTIQQPK